MMMTTWSDAENIQDDRGIDSSATLSSAAAFRFTSFGAAPPCQTPTSGNRAGDRALASLWFRRLKPRDEPESSNAEKFSSTETKHHIASKEGEFNAIEKEPSACGLGRGRKIPLHMLSSISTGFERVQVDASERLPISVTNSRYTSGVLQTSSQRWAVEGRISVLPGAQAEGSSFAGRPPLPRVHGKCGLRPTCRITSSATDGGMFAVAPRITSSASKETLLTVTIPKGPVLKEGHQGLDHGIVATKKEEVTGNGNTGVTQATPSFVLNPTKQYGGHDCNVMTMTLSETPRLKNQTGLETSRLGGVKVQSAQTGGEPSFLTERMASKPAIDCCESSAKDNKTFEASPNASNMATFPWEMFAEAGGPSKSARQEFVAVYNRARNELKNQRASGLATKVVESDAESFPGLTSRGATFEASTSTAFHVQNKRAGSQLKFQEKLVQVSQPEEIPKRQLCASFLESATFEASTSTAFHEQNSRAGSQLKIQEKLVQVSQPEEIPKRQHCASFLEREVTKQTSQANGGIHLAGGKESSSVLHNEHGGAFHRYAEPSSDALGACHRTLRESSSLRLGLATSRAHPEPCNRTLFGQKRISQPKFLSEIDVKEMDIKAPMLLSKRQAGHLDESPAVETGKESGKQHENSPCRSEVWLQRWSPSQKNSKEHKPLKLNRHGPGLAGHSKLLTEATEKDSYVRYREERDLKKRLTEKGFLLQGGVAEAADPELAKPYSGRVIPSAAAMAIVGTAAHQFCTMQRQTKKDSFAVWSGFGIPAPQASKSFAEAGQGKHLSKFEPSSKC